MYSYVKYGKESFGEPVAKKQSLTTCYIQHARMRLMMQLLLMIRRRPLLLAVKRRPLPLVRRPLALRKRSRRRSLLPLAVVRRRLLPLHGLGEARGRLLSQRKLKKKQNRNVGKGVQKSNRQYSYFINSFTEIVFTG